MEVKLDLRWLFLGWFVILLPLPSAAASIDRVIRIQPIQVCSDDETICANPGQILFGGETKKIWAQAGINVEFLPWHRFRGTSWLDLTVGTFDNFNIFNLAGTLGHGQNADPKVINLWFVRSIGGGGYYGHSLQNGNGIAMADNVFAANSGVDRLDVIAHEMGHNLGLDHTTFGAGGATNVMSASRQVPAAQTDIFPDGQLLDQLTAAQVGPAHSSQFAGLLPPRLSVSFQTNKVVLSWLQQSGFVLEWSPTVTGMWNQAASQTSPYVDSLNGSSRFFRLKK